MVDTPRSGSLPLLNEEDVVQNVLNPAYSGSVTTSARYSTHQDIIEMEIEMGKPIETPSMKRIKFAIIVLFLLIGLLIVINISHLVVSISERGPVIEEKDTSVSDLEAIIDIAIISAPENITEEFGIAVNRTYSQNGLDNYIANMDYFSTGTVDFGETQFAESESQLRKLLNPMRDPKRNDTSKRCDIYTYITKYSNNNKVTNANKEHYINGSILYENQDKIPSRVDLRRRGILTDVRNQGTSCNAGYSFAVTDLLESKVDTNGQRLSVQMLLSSDYNHHCEGGETFRAMKAAEEEGIVTEDILPFDETQQWHDIGENETRFKFENACVLLGSRIEGETYYDQRAQSYRVIRETNITASTYIKQFLAKIGTVVVEVPVNRSFFFYKNGLYSPDCANGTILGYQPAVLVGYGKRNGEDIWILRNSFGTEWGINGDFEMSSTPICGTFDYAFTFYKAIDNF